MRDLPLPWRQRVGVRGSGEGAVGGEIKIACLGMKILISILRWRVEDGE
jgi:hypothetical protein